ncbi:MAG: SufD family Fe-S cluster assembly protein [Spirochaetia bacterium]
MSSFLDTKNRPVRSLRLEPFLEQLNTTPDLRSADRSAWKDAVKLFFETGIPGKPDEVWRRFPAESLDPSSCVPAGAEYELLDRNLEPVSGISGLETVTYGSAFSPEEKHAYFRDTLAAEIGKSKKRNPGAPNDLRENKFTYLNRAFSRENYYLRLEKGAELPGPLLLRAHPESGAEKPLFLPRIMIHLEPGAQAELAVVFLGGSGGMTAGSLRILLEPGASLKILTAAGLDSPCYLEQQAVLRDEAVMTGDFMQAGSAGSNGMIDQLTVLQGRGSSYSGSGIVLAGEETAQGQKIRVEQNGENTRSELLVKSLVHEGSRSIFNGILRMPKGAKGASGNERNLNLLLGKNSRAYALPQLEIVENDVECSHGSSVSSVDPEELYFLQTRGLSPDAGRRLLIQSFIRQITDNMAVFSGTPRIRKFITETIGVPELDYEYSED